VGDDIHSVIPLVDDDKPEFCTDYRSEAPERLFLKGSWSDSDSQA